MDKHDRVTSQLQAPLKGVRAPMVVAYGHSKCRTGPAPLGIVHQIANDIDPPDGPLTPGSVANLDKADGRMPDGRQQIEHDSCVIAGPDNDDGRIWHLPDHAPGGTFSARNCAPGASRYTPCVPIDKRA